MKTNSELLDSYFISNLTVDSIAKLALFALDRKRAVGLSRFFKDLKKYKLIKDSLRIFENKSQRAGNQLKEFNLNQLIKDTIHLLHPLCKFKKTKITYKENCDPSLAYIQSDYRTLHQILYNILSCLINFGKKSSIKIDVRYLRKHQDKTNFFEIRIKDPRIGLNEDDMSKIFFPLKSKKGYRDKKIEINNSSIQKMTKALGGEIRLIKTTTPKDSVVSIRLTDYKEERKGITKMQIAKQDFHSLESKEILIVDDSIDNLEIIKLFLNSYGGQPDIANGGNEALKKIQSKKYDVILMDIEMPNMNGFQVIKELHNLKNRTPVIALTAHAMPEDKAKTKNAGFFDHVTKPIDFNYLVARIENMH